VRVLRSAGATLDCGSGTQWMRPPSHNVLQRGASGSAGPARVEVLQWLEGLPLAKFNESTGGKRLIFGKMASELWAIIHCGAFETYHRVEFEDVLAVEEMVAPPTHTFLVRLQTVEANDADQRDLIAWLCAHEVSVGPTPDAIEATSVTALCAEDWGWYRTALRNLDRLRFLGSGGRLPASPHVRHRIEGLYQSIERAPKSVRWHMRARVGDWCPRTRRRFSLRRRRARRHTESLFRRCQCWRRPCVSPTFARPFPTPFPAPAAESRIVRSASRPERIGFGIIGQLFRSRIRQACPIHRNHLTPAVSAPTAEPASQNPLRAAPSAEPNSPPAGRAARRRPA